MSVKKVLSAINVHIDVVNDIINFALETGFDVKGLTFSPIKGPEGNIEYLIYLQNGNGKCEIEHDIAQKIVTESHLELDK